jgi:hypothetical protein
LSRRGRSCGAVIAGCPAFPHNAAKDCFDQVESVGCVVVDGKISLKREFQRANRDGRIYGFIALDRGFVLDYFVVEGGLYGG